MSLTAKQRIRLTREARRLAMQCANGTAPRFGRGYSGRCACAVGTAFKRARVDWWEGSLAIGSEYHHIFRISLSEPPPEVYTFPLLALADELEDARSAK